ncbi:ATP-binding protein [Leifsonia shinshuensis]|uniref:ATP-binding protein n=1 Tax=Leifsonia shinshuensis TaxID=150026 RepID=A0A7G6YFP5_9MICO|nr:DUF87 domain-containing protein [Leifsonia shinshuensis]QNE37310.1 ATP-binding protein [Leifsonia shinshuensis]
MTSGPIRPWVRVAILLVAVTSLGLIAWTKTGEFIPSDPADALLLQSSILLVVLGSLILEKYFTAPGDALVNSFTALITMLPLLPLLASESLAIWGVVATYLGVVMAASAACLTLQSQSNRTRGRRTMAIAYLIASRFGRARVVFSVVFLASLFFFASSRSSLALALLVFWGLYLAIWPLGIPQLLSRLRLGQEARDKLVGHLDRVDSPNLARVALAAAGSWPIESESVVLAHLPDGSSRWCVPLFRENRSDGVWATFAISDSLSTKAGRAGTLVIPHDVAGPSRSDLIQKLTGGLAHEVAGVVRESSTLTHLRVEILPDQLVGSGQVLVVPVADELVYFQVTGMETSEEPFGGLHYGSQIATAVQIGVLRGERFHRFDYLPPMNALAYFAAVPPAETEVEGLFPLGDVPGTGVTLYGNFIDQMESHTAILGATGTGKTEFAFDLIRYSVANGVKVICLDLTSQYAPRLADLAPIELSIPGAKATELGEKLFAAETGAYGAGAEKKILASFANGLRSDIRITLEKFYQGDGGALGLIELTEISNTKATLWITEIYLSTLLELAKEGATSGQKTLVVVEEAHTVMPEAAFAGLGDFDSKGTIAKITQIALQGRKYGVGLLVLAQRTATVSKSVLTQCNTVISFSCIDDTSINFLKNVFGSAVAEGLPSLPRLRAVAEGSWIEAELPVAFDVPFDAQKAERKDWASQLAAGDALANSTDANNPDPETPF